MTILSVPEDVLYRDLHVNVEADVISTKSEVVGTAINDHSLLP